VCVCVCNCLQAVNSTYVLATTVRDNLPTVGIHIHHNIKMLPALSLDSSLPTISSMDCVGMDLYGFVRGEGH
jgi:hypothetical protein